MLEISNLKVSLKNSDKVILNNLSLKINDGEVHVIMGPNGTGKSTLAKVIMKHYLYNIDEGEIRYNNKLLNDLKTNEIASEGIFLSMQEPVSVSGVKNSEFLKVAMEEKNKEHIEYFPFIKLINKSLEDLKLNKDFAHRELNVGFSGGEKKKNEVLAIKVLKPSFIILDEIDSGLDIDSLKIVCQNINEYLKENKNTSVLIITHYPKILEYLKPTYVHIMNHGTIVNTGDISLVKKIEEEGYHVY